MRIDLHIERLVIDGASLDGAALDGDAVRAALTRELSQLLAAAPPALAGLAVPSVRAHAPPAPMSTAESLASGVAHALHGALAPGPGTPR